MAIGPTSLPIIPPSGGQRGSIAESPDRRDARESARAGAEIPIDTIFAEPLDGPERRQFELEQTADQVRQLNPNAPRGTILNILV